MNLKNFNSNDSSGKALMNCDSVEGCVFLTNTKNAKNVALGGVVDSSNFFSSIDIGINSTDIYGSISAGDDSSSLYFCGEIGKCSYLYYSYFLENCSYCLGCVGLKNRSFCIFNKQYSKDERYKLVDKIFAQMEKYGELGEFFPAWLNPFYFNDTVAYLIDDSFTKEEVEKAGYLWRDEKIKVDVPEGSEIVHTTPLNPPLQGGSYSPTSPARGGTQGGVLSDYQGFDENGEWKIDPEILKKVIKDENGNFYRVVPMELKFLEKYGLPLPELHRLDRIKLGFKFK